MVKVKSLGFYGSDDFYKASNTTPLLKLPRSTIPPMLKSQNKKPNCWKNALEYGSYIIPYVAYR